MHSCAPMYVFLLMCACGRKQCERVKRKKKCEIDTEKCANKTENKAEKSGKMRQNVRHKTEKLRFSKTLRNYEIIDINKDN